MSDRRNPFGKTPDASIPASPPDIFESLPVAAPRERDRAWERKNHNRKAVYRGVDPKAALQVKQIAADLQVPTGEVIKATRGQYIGVNNGKITKVTQSYLTINETLPDGLGCWNTRNVKLALK